MGLAQPVTKCYETAVRLTTGQDFSVDTLSRRAQGPSPIQPTLLVNWVHRAVPSGVPGLKLEADDSPLYRAEMKCT
jgi:hypothetical protein